MGMLLTYLAFVLVAADGCDCVHAQIACFAVPGEQHGVGGDVLVACDVLTVAPKRRFAPALGLHATADRRGSRMGLAFGMRAFARPIPRTWYAQGILGFYLTPGSGGEPSTPAGAWFAGIEVGRHEGLALAVALEAVGDPATVAVPFHGHDSPFDPSPTLCVGLRCGGRPGLLGLAGVVVNTVAMAIHELDDE